MAEVEVKDSGKGGKKGQQKKNEKSMWTLPPWLI